MASDMGWWCAVWFCVIGLASAKVTLNGVWKENRGLEVTCKWEIPLNDVLQSVTLLRNEIQYVQYRPQNHGLKYATEYHSNEFLMNIICQEASPQGQRGSCVTKMDLYLNATEDTFTCEVSGEGPLFRTEHQTYTVFVPPSNAEVSATTESQGQETRRILNCTSSGVPAPRLVWSVNGQRVPSDFSKAVWNSKTKLWDSWASFNPQEDVKAKCTPEVTTKFGIVERAQGASEWNGASWIGLSKMILSVAIVLPFLR